MSKFIANENELIYYLIIVKGKLIKNILESINIIKK